MIEIVSRVGRGYWYKKEERYQISSLMCYVLCVLCLCYYDTSSTSYPILFHSATSGQITLKLLFLPGKTKLANRLIIIYVLYGIYCIDT